MAHITGQSRYQATLYPEVLDEVIAPDSTVRVIDVATDRIETPEEVADTIAVGVLEGARVDLVDDGFFPPFGLVAVDEMGRGVSLGRGLLAMAGGGRCDEGCREESGKNGRLDHQAT